MQIKILGKDNFGWKFMAI